MDKEAFKQLLNGIDLAQLLPDVGELLAFVAPTTQFLAAAGSFVMLAFGLFCLMIAPREATYALGYRFRWGMASPESWRFMQRLAGVVFALLGLGSAIVVALFTRHFADLPLMELMAHSAICIAQQAVVALAGCLVTNFLVVVRYNRKGIRRYTWAELFRG